MRDLAILFIHLLVTIARLFRPGGARSIVAESLLVKHQLLILNRSRARAPDLRPSDRLIAGLCASLMRVGRKNSIGTLFSNEFAKSHGPMVAGDATIPVTLLSQ